MNFSAARSSSAVVTPGRQRSVSIARQRATIWPQAAIASISSGVLRIITRAPNNWPSGAKVPDGFALGREVPLDLLLKPQARQRGPDLGVDLVRTPAAVHAAQDLALLVVTDQGLRLLPVLLEPVLDDFRAVVVANDQTASIQVAALVVLWRVVLHVEVVLSLHANPPAREPADHLRFRDFDQERRRKLAAELLELPIQRLCLGLRAWKSVEDEPVCGV